MTAPEPSPYPPSSFVPPPGAGFPAYGPPGYPPPGPGYGAPGYPLPGYPLPGYPPPGYPPAGYGYGPSPWPQHGPRPWPHGGGRPAVATAAGVLGIVTGGVTALACFFFLAISFAGDGDATSTLLLVLGVPCAVGTIAGGIRLLGGHRRGLLLGSAVAAIASLLLTLVVGALVYTGDDVAGFALVIGVALALPVVTAILGAQQVVKGWTEGLPPY